MFGELQSKERIFLLLTTIHKYVNQQTRGDRERNGEEKSILNSSVTGSVLLCHSNLLKRSLCMKNRENTSSESLNEY